MGAAAITSLRIRRAFYDGAPTRLSFFVWGFAGGTISLRLFEMLLE